jgi:hypothetical protein
MSIKQRVIKIERSIRKNELVLVSVNEGETNEEAYQRCLPDGYLKPKVVICIALLFACCVSGATTYRHACSTSD